MGPGFRRSSSTTRCRCMHASAAVSGLGGRAAGRWVRSQTVHFVVSVNVDVGPQSLRPTFAALKPFIGDDVIGVHPAQRRR